MSSYFSCATGCALPGWRWFLGVPLLVWSDQASKHWISSHLTVGQVMPVMPNLQLQLSHNSGIAFSLLSHQPDITRIILISFIAVVCVVLAVLLAKTPPRGQTGYSIALLLILSGALGNLWDRVQYGYVIDFIDFYIKTWHWYTFNIADSWITIGMILLTKSILFDNPEVK